MEETRPVLMIEQMSEESENRIRKSLKGIFLASMSALLSSVSFLAVKFITQVSTSQITLVNFSQTSVYSFITILITRNFYPFVLKHSNSATETSLSQQQELKENSFLKPFLVLLFSGLMHAIATYLHFNALQDIPIGEATVIRLSATVFVYLLAKIFLGELIGLFNWLMLFMSIVGITLVSKVEFIFGHDKNGLDFERSKYQRLWPFLMAIMSCFFFAINTIIWRKYNTISPAMFSFFDGIIGTVLFTIIITISSDLKTNIPINQWFFLAILGLFFFLELMFYYNSLQHENANVCSLVRSTLRVLIGFLFQVIFFDTIPDAWTITGTIIVTTSISLISLKKIWNKKW